MLKKYIVFPLIILLFISSLIIVFIGIQKDTNLIKLLKPYIFIYVFSFFFLILISKIQILRHIKLSYAFIFIFFILLIIPMILTLKDTGKNKIDAIENRTLNERPKLPKNALALYKFPNQFMDYIDDNIPFRELGIKFYNTIYLDILNESPNNKVILGKDGWLFYTGDNDNFVIKDLVGHSLFTMKQLQNIKNNLEVIENYCQSKDIVFLFVIAPNKESIYPEYLPENIIPSDMKRLSQLDKYLKTHSSIDILNLTKTLLDNKNNQFLYYKTDTHWNDLGAFYAYEAISKSFNMDPLNIKNYTFTVNENFSGGLSSGMLHTNKISEKTHILKSNDIKKSTIREKSNFFKSTQIDNSELPTIVIYGDSFYEGMSQYFEESFKYLNAFTWRKTSEQIITMDIDFLLNSKPNYFIFEMVERNIYLLADMIIKF
ncbi:hypothetical protein MASR2M78_31480 [Treponema sp.]